MDFIELRWLKGQRTRLFTIIGCTASLVLALISLIGGDLPGAVQAGLFWLLFVANACAGEHGVD